MSVLVAAGEFTPMKHTPALGAALCAALLFTPLVRAQTDLYVGSNTPANTLDFTNGTNSLGAGVPVFYEHVFHAFNRTHRQYLRSIEPADSTCVTCHQYLRHLPMLPAIARMQSIV